MTYDEQRKVEDKWTEDTSMEMQQHVIVNSRSRRVKNDIQVWLMFIPILEVIIPIISMAGCYMIAFTRGDVEGPPFVPYLSQLGNRQPQSCVFTMGVAASSFLSILVVMLRYRQVSLLHEGLWNKGALLFGIISALSKLLLACFQYQEFVMRIHYTACVSYFVSTILFCCTQVYLTRKTRLISSKYLFLVRLLLLEIIIVCSVVFGIFFLPKLNYMNRPPNSVSQITHWLLLVAIHLFSLTFITDLRQILFSFDVWVSPKTPKKNYFSSLKKNCKAEASVYERASARSEHSSTKTMFSFISINRKCSVDTNLTDSKSS